MVHKALSLIQKLDETHHLTTEEYLHLLENRTPEVTEKLAALAVRRAKEVYGNRIFIRGLMEISNICRNGCHYCGISRENKSCQRYRLTPEQIFSCAQEGYTLGFRTFVMQGGEDSWFTDERLASIIRHLKEQFPDCAVTLSLGERSRESYQTLFDAGADRYLLRHETADPVHYGTLHPADLSWEHRMRCLQDLHEIGFQTGCGFMVGSPFQTLWNIAKDLSYIEAFSPEMCGIGPFIPHKDTVFRDFPPGSADLTCFLLSIIRVMKPNVLLPATTALGTIDPMGREKGILSGANVVMPNLSPAEVRDKYMLYNNKLRTGPEAAQNLFSLQNRMQSIGYEIAVDRGDFQAN